MKDNKETIKVLNQLLQGEYMALESFNLFISRMDDKNIKDELLQIQKEHRNNIESLSNYILDIGGKPEENIGMMGRMGGMILRNQLGHSSDANEVIEKAIDGEIKGISKTEKILRGNLDDDSRKLTGGILENDRSTIDKLRNLLSWFLACRYSYNVDVDI